MKVRQLRIKNFRGISDGEINFVGHTLLVGGNNIGKSTVCEALDLVLGPERMYRRPVVNEHDFYKNQYLNEESVPVEIIITVLLTDLGEELERRFKSNARRWNDSLGKFVDELGEGIEASDADSTMWALPLIFIGRYDSEEDDFIGNTFFDHPQKLTDDDDQNIEIRIGSGRKVFGRDHKRRCGFIFLRTLRTGSRALSLQRGSLLDTVLRLAGGGLTEMWEDTLKRMRELEPPIGEIQQLQNIRAELQSRMAQFVKLADEGNATAFFASDLTREHLREVVRLFISAEPDPHLVPFRNLGTGSVNLLVFALLTFIADLKGSSSVIFAMEEPEIAIPPHTQRRVTKYILSEMGQAIFTSHSPYVIEQFQPEQIVMLERSRGGVICGNPVAVQDLKTKNYRRERRQMAEAILARAVLVVEGWTEEAIFPLASEILEKNSIDGSYVHLDLAGVTIFNAGGDGGIPMYGPFFRSLGKKAFALYDKPNSPFNTEANAKLAHYTQSWELPEKGIEKYLANNVPIGVIRLFLSEVSQREDYPATSGVSDDSMTDENIRRLAAEVLKARKGEGYGAILIAQCKAADELPPMIREVLETINNRLSGDVSVNDTPEINGPDNT